MSKVKKMAHPSAGTLEQAERESHCASGNSRNKHITQGPSGQRKVADLLSHGRENAIPRRELERLTGLDGRTVRLMIERERREGRPIVADNAIPATEHERAACVRHRAAEAIDRAGV